MVALGRKENTQKRLQASGVVGGRRREKKARKRRKKSSKRGRKKRQGLGKERPLPKKWTALEGYRDQLKKKKRDSSPQSMEGRVKRAVRTS